MTQRPEEPVFHDEWMPVLLCDWLPDTTLGMAVRMLRKKWGITGGPDDLSRITREWDHGKRRILLSGLAGDLFQPGLDGGFTHIVLRAMMDYSRPAYFCATRFPDRVAQLRILSWLPRHIWLGPHVTSHEVLERLGLRAQALPRTLRGAGRWQSHSLAQKTGTSRSPRHRRLGPLTPPDQYRLFLEILDDRQGTGATFITSQYPVNTWHELAGDPTVGDAILDRLVHNAHKLELKGDSLRKKGGKT